MKIGPFEIAIHRAAAVVTKATDLITHLPTWTRGWYPIIRESFSGAWQRNVVVNQQEVLQYSTVWACITLIAADIAKLWLKLTEEDADGICTETENPAYSPVLRKPNRYSTRVKFFEYWIISKLSTGNTYALKARNDRGGAGQGNVVALYILDPARVAVLVAPDGSVFYQLGTDALAGVDEASVVVPAREIIHDICVPLFHPLCGVSPIFACGLAAMQGLKIQDNSTKLFANGSQPGGVLSTPKEISNDTAKRLEEYWQANYAGEQNIGKIVVLGDDLKYTPMAMTAVDSEVVAQLKMTDERICATFHVPGYMVGIGSAPPYTDIQSINLQYYQQALQNPIENLEILLQEGLEIEKPLGVEFDLKALLRMDTKTQVENATKGILGGLFKPNEARADFDLKPVPGGNSVYLQQQQFSLEALAARDALGPAPAHALPAAPAPAPAAIPARKPKPAAKDLDELDLETADIADQFRKALAA
jgi:HK97 family phage portal protein